MARKQRKSPIGGAYNPVCCKADIVREALTKTPDIASKTLARQLVKAHPKVFVNIEAARNAVRYVRNARGAWPRMFNSDPIPRPPEDAEACRKWGALLPEPEPSEWGWRELPGDVARWLIIADIHVPYYDREAVDVMLRHADGNCDGVLILGDLADAYQLSPFQRDPRKRDLGVEVGKVCQFLDALRQMRGIKAIVWKGGNHEARLERYMMGRAPELFTGALAERFSWQSFCELEAKGVQWVRPQDPIRHHQLAILHGHEWGNRFSSPVNTARGAFLKAHECVIQGHEHRSSYHPESTLFGTVIRCWSVGCLSDLHPEYRPLGHKWDQGCAYLNAGENWSIENHTLINGQVY